MKLNKLTFLLLAISIFSCSNDSEDDLTDNVPLTNNNNSVVITYTEHIQPIMQSSCVGCHASPPVSGAPFALTNYNQVSQRANAVLNSMNLQSGAAGAMPPSGRLPQSTIDLIQLWIEGGKLEN